MSDSLNAIHRRGVHVLPGYGPHGEHFVAVVDSLGRRRFLGVAYADSDQVTIKRAMGCLLDQLDPPATSPLVRPLRVLGGLLAAFLG